MSGFRRWLALVLSGLLISAAASAAKTADVRASIISKSEANDEDSDCENPEECGQKEAREYNPLEMALVGSSLIWSLCEFAIIWKIGWWVYVKYHQRQTIGPRDGPHELLP